MFEGMAEDLLVELELSSGGGEIKGDVLRIAQVGAELRFVDDFGQVFPACSQAFGGNIEAARRAAAASALLSASPTTPGAGAPRTTEPPGPISCDLGALGQIHLTGVAP